MHAGLPENHTARLRDNPPASPSRTAHAKEPANQCRGQQVAQAVPLTSEARFDLSPAIYWRVTKNAMRAQFRLLLRP
jgi:hypothetical protein